MEVSKIAKVLFVVLTLTLFCSGVSAVAVPGQSTSPAESLTYNLKDEGNFTSPDTLVVAVAEDSNYKVLSIADEIADHNEYAMVSTSPNSLSPYVLETIQQMMAYGNLENVIVVGTHENTTTISDVLRNVKDPLHDTELTVSSTIQAENINELARTSAVYVWDNSSEFVVTDCDIQSDFAKGMLVGLNEDIPILCEDSGYDKINTTMQLLSEDGVNKVYVTPAVQPDLVSDLEANFTVNDSYTSGFTNDFEVVSADYYNSTSQGSVFVMVKEDDITPYDTFFKVAGNLGTSGSGFLIADNSTDLGTNQSSALSSMNPNMTILIGNISVAEEPLANEISSITGNSPWRVDYDNSIELQTEAGIIGSGYIHPIVITTFTQDNSTFNYKFKNIGFSDVIKFGDYTLKATFTKTSGTFEDSTPAPDAQDSDEVLYKFDDNIHPMDYLSLTFVASEGANFTTIPELRYYSETLAGNVQPHQGFLDQLVSYFEGAADWFSDTFNSVVGVFDAVIPAPSYVVQAISAIVLFLVMWIIVGTLVYFVKDILLGSKIEQPLLYGPVVWVIKGKVYGETY